METRTVPDSDLDDKRAKLADALDPRTPKLTAQLYISYHQRAPA